MDSNEFARTIVFDETLVEEAFVERTPKFYVVSLKKFWLLFIASWGLYQLYWFYKNWKNFKLFTKQDLWPVPRAIFSIFFVHDLFKHVTLSLNDTQTGISKSLQTHATIFVITSLILSFVGYFPDMAPSYNAAITIAGYALLAWLMSKAQVAINLACADEKGLTNNVLTPGNWAWILIGGLVWVLNIFGILLLK